MSDHIVRGESAEDEGIPELEDQPLGKILAGDTGEGLTPPRDHALAADDFGTTPAEESLGEDLRSRVAREVPDVGDEAHDGGGLGVRLVQPDQGAVDLDESADEVAAAVGDHAGLSAEEAAIRIEEEPGGMTDGWPGYLDEEGA